MPVQMQSVQCPKCDTTIDISGLLPRKAESFTSRTIRCDGCDCSVGVSFITGETCIVYDPKDDIVPPVYVPTAAENNEGAARDAFGYVYQHLTFKRRKAS